MVDCRLDLGVNPIFETRQVNNRRVQIGGSQ
jgi:hypothetical protein